MNKSVNKKSCRARANDAVVTRMLKRLRRGGDVRKAKVRHVKSALRHDAYVNLLKLEVATDRLANDLTGRQFN